MAIRTFRKRTGRNPLRQWHHHELTGSISSLLIHGEIGLGENFRDTEPGVYFTSARTIIIESGLKVLDDDLELEGFDNQADGAFSLNYILAESHLHIHTWPEKGVFQYDINTCNYLQNNDRKAIRVTRQIIKLFGANRYVLHEFKTVTSGEAQ